LGLNKRIYEERFELDTDIDGDEIQDIKDNIAELEDCYI